MAIRVLLTVALACTGPTVSAHVQEPAANERVAEVSSLHFHSAFWMNLHHTLYGAAWARRPEAGTLKALAGALPAPLDAPLTETERAAWAGAIDYYDRELARRDLLFDRGMTRVRAALAAGDLGDDAVDAGLRRTLEAAAPVYRRHFWPSHDKANRDWIAMAADRIRTIAPDTIRLLETFYGVAWFTSPVRVDVVWVGNRQGAYTTNGRVPHVTISSGDPDQVGWTAAEIAFHEVSHALVLPLQEDLTKALGARVREHGVLWHVIQFYLTGAAVRQALRTRGIDYEPYLYSSGLIERAWPRYRAPVESAWRPFVDGRTSRGDAIAATLKALGIDPDVGSLSFLSSARRSAGAGRWAR